jgi:hypothetical protein
LIWSATLPPYHREATYAAKPEHLEVRAPRSAIDPLELNWDPARERRVVEAGIVSGCAELIFLAEVTGTESRRDLETGRCELLVVNESRTRSGADLYGRDEMRVLSLNRKV